MNKRGKRLLAFHTPNPHNHPLRRASDASQLNALRQQIRLEDKMIEQLAQALCPPKIAKRYQQLNFSHQHAGKTLVIFPIWRRYRREALRIMMVYRFMPWLRPLPLGVTRWVALLLLE